jgi:hypothetical protein
VARETPRAIVEVLEELAADRDGLTVQVDSKDSFNTQRHVYGPANYLSLHGGHAILPDPALHQPALRLIDMPGEVSLSHSQSLWKIQRDLASHPSEGILRERLDVFKVIRFPESVVSRVKKVLLYFLLKHFQSSLPILLGVIHGIVLVTLNRQDDALDGFNVLNNQVILVVGDWKVAFCASDLYESIGRIRPGNS